MYEALGWNKKSLTFFLNDILQILSNILQERLADSLEICTVYSTNENSKYF